MLTTLTTSDYMQVFRALAEYFSLSPKEQASFFRIPASESNRLQDFFNGTNPAPDNDWQARLIEFFEFHAIANDMLPYPRYFSRQILDDDELKQTPIEICTTGAIADIKSLNLYMSCEF